MTSLSLVAWKSRPRAVSFSLIWRALVMLPVNGGNPSREIHVMKGLDVFHRVVTGGE